ncbi:exonuclease domain-containing protein [Marimonas sp. MJW-29]|uniref:Exonuclease domain-containing protein n=1 Tax=Sulfitobacter sediminis TaxID=3234186 RepID=A0ABV3RTH8_9RHOB
MFAFYDFETTGTSPAFDQPLQFAALLVDDDLREVDRRNLRCRLEPHILPAPMALAITGVTPELLMDASLDTWFGFSQAVAKTIMDWSSATWVGYNSINFDENVMRQMFYQNLHPDLYLTQTGGNSRMDVMQMVYAVRELAPEALEWPTDENGRSTFRLDRLAPSNGFAEHNAHDALGDVRATLHILSLLKHRTPEVYERCLHNRDKATVIEDLQRGDPMRLILRFGAAPPRSYYGVYAGKIPDNPNALAFLDLDACNAADLLGADDATLDRAVSGSPKLIRTVSANQVPNLFPVENPKPDWIAAASAVAAHPDFRSRVGAALARRFVDREEPEHVEERIYSGFYSGDDKRALRDFQKSDWAQRVEIVESLGDERLKQLGRRIIHSNASHLLPESYLENAKNQIRARWHSNEINPPWTTHEVVEQQLTELGKRGVVSRETLRDLRSFYTDRMSE